MRVLGAGYPSRVLAPGSIARQRPAGWHTFRANPRPRIEPLTGASTPERDPAPPLGAGVRQRAARALTSAASFPGRAPARAASIAVTILVHGRHCARKYSHASSAPSTDLPFRVELWDRSDQHIRWVIAASSSVALDMPRSTLRSLTFRISVSRCATGYLSFGSIRLDTQIHGHSAEH